MINWHTHAYKTNKYKFDLTTYWVEFQQIPKVVNKNFPSRNMSSRSIFFFYANLLFSCDDEA